MVCAAAMAANASAAAQRQARRRKSEVPDTKLPCRPNGLQLSGEREYGPSRVVRQGKNLSLRSGKGFLKGLSPAVPRMALEAERPHQEHRHLAPGHRSRRA